MKMQVRLAVAAAIAVFAAGHAVAAAPNLVPNGDFTAGNTGFSSSYAFHPSGNTAEGQYTIRTNPSPWNALFISAGDHTTGSGEMIVANGSPVDGAIVWQSGEIVVDPSTDYFFDAWVMNVCCTPLYTGDNSASILEFSINGISLGTKTTDLDKAGTWEGLSTTWNSGAATTAVLSLINRNTDRGGNDFAIDDVSLSTEPFMVPEPETYALMLAGLAGIGVAMRGRRAR
jgi:PEP-CTERM motif